MLGVTGPNGASHVASGTLPTTGRALVPEWPSLRGRPARVISATSHRPAAIASAACATCAM